MLLQVKEEYGHFPDVEIIPPEKFSVESLEPREREIFSRLDPYLGYLGSSLSFDVRNTRQALQGTGISFTRTYQEFLKKIINYALEAGYFLKPD